MKKRHTYLQLICLSCFSLFLLFGCSEIDRFSPYQYQKLDNYFEEYELVEFNTQDLMNQLRDNKNGELDIDLKIESHPDWKFKMVSQEFIGKDAPIYLVGEGEQLTRVYDTEEAYMIIGYQNGSSEKSHFMFNDNKIEGLIGLENDAYLIEPASNIDPKLDDSQHIIYKASAILQKNDVKCHYDKLNPSDADPSQYEQYIEQPDKSADRGGNCWKVQLGVQSDYAYYIYKVGNNYHQAMHRINWDINCANLRFKYYNNYPIDVIRTVTFVRTYSSTIAGSFNSWTTFLNEWKNWGNNYSNGYRQHRQDINLLFTGYNVSGAVGGAYPNRLCQHGSSQSYAFAMHVSDHYSRHNVIAHEFSHIMGCNDHITNGAYALMDPWARSHNWTNNPFSDGATTSQKITRYVWNGGNGHNSCLHTGGCIH